MRKPSKSLVVPVAPKHARDEFSTISDNQLRGIAAELLFQAGFKAEPDYLETREDALTALRTLMFSIKVSRDLTAGFRVKHPAGTVTKDGQLRRPTRRKAA